jgi:hypothetical protein
VKGANGTGGATLRLKMEVKWGVWAGWRTRWRGSHLCCLLWIVVGIGFLLD